jgi:hypothetical protein
MRKRVLKFKIIEQTTETMECQEWNPKKGKSRSEMLVHWFSTSSIDFCTFSNRNSACNRALATTLRNASGRLNALPLLSGPAVGGGDGGGVGDGAEQAPLMFTR